MANAYERGKKKRTYRKIDNDISFEFYNSEKNMKSPVNFYPKPTSLSKYKGYKFGDDSFNNYHSTKYDKFSKVQNGDIGDYHSVTKPSRYTVLHKDGVQEDVSSQLGNDSNSENVNVVTPVILSREKIGTEKSATLEVKKFQNKESEVAPKQERESSPTSTKRYQIASKPSNFEGIVIAEQNMKTSMKLLDDSLLIGEDLNPFLLDQSEFLVVAVVGMQGSGKSTVASQLADPWKGFKFKNDCSFIFQPETKEEVLSGCHTTSGIDVFVTKDRVMILDLQPLLSPSVMDYIVMQERKSTMDYSSTENLLEVESLQLLSFAMSVAHVLVVVQDYFVNPNLVRLLHTCQMMKPSQSSGGGLESGSGESSGQHQFFPHLVFVHNRTYSHHFRPQFVKELQAMYQVSFRDSELCLGSEVGVSSGTFSVPLNQETTKGNINVFLIPDSNYDNKCCVSFNESIKEMRRQIFNLPRFPLSHVSLTEKSWYQFSCRMWETIRKSSLYVEYSRYLP